MMFKQCLINPPMAASFDWVAFEATFEIALAIVCFTLIACAFLALSLEALFLGPEIDRWFHNRVDGAKRAVRNVRTGWSRARYALRMGRFDRRLRRDDARRDLERRIEEAAFDVLVEEQYAADVARWEERPYRSYFPSRYDAAREVEMFLRLDGSNAVDWV